MERVIKKNKKHELVSETDEIILFLLSEGLNQQKTHEYMKDNGYKPNSVSYIEKALNRLRKDFEAGSNFHLALIMHKKGII